MIDGLLMNIPNSMIERDQLVAKLRCPGCQGALTTGSDCAATSADEVLLCAECGESFPIVDGVPRMLLSPLREALGGAVAADRAEAHKAATAESFGFEWHRFPEMHREWEQNFLDYLAPRLPEFFRGKRVLDAGCGSGRHAHFAAKFGAEVVAADIGPAVEVARRNTAEFPSALIVQCDLYALPLAPESFDFVYSLGVLHHLPDPEAGFRNLLRFVKPGGEIQVYLYWEPEGRPVKRVLLYGVSALRAVTTRLPHRLLYALSYPAAFGAFAAFVWPYQVFRRIPGLRKLAEHTPMRQYADYPFRVCVNDQFDRFSAPIENRYTKAEVEAWLRRAGLEDIRVFPFCGWVGSGRKPLNPVSDSGECAAVSGSLAP
ncbi:MAG: methyltransferase domain-containing protein [Isosphaeraceae bacterium]|nr:methyltransferase domain-containing protein [Isosphaeraceae bacterium]